MWDVLDNEFAWDFFENTGNIESYLLYKEYNNLRVETENNEHNTDSSTGAENL